MMHVKVYLVGGALSVVGSINVNRRSFGETEDVGAAIRDRRLTRILEQHFVDGVSRSVPVGCEDRRGLAGWLTTEFRKPFSSGL